MNDDYKKLSYKELAELQSSISREMSNRLKAKRDEDIAILQKCCDDTIACLKANLPNVPISYERSDMWRLQIDIKLMMLEELIPIHVEPDECSERKIGYPFQNCSIIVWHDTNSQSFVFTSTISEDNFSTCEEVVLDLKSRFKHMYECLGKYLGY
jgi:hypothetical protein